MEAPGFLFSLISFISMFTVLVFVHEWGHYYVARRNGVKVEVFSIGFGPEIFGWYDKNGTRWKISWVPLGGYVKFFGDAGAASNADNSALGQMTEAEKQQSFHFKSLKQKAAIVAAGPLVNLLLAVAIFVGFGLAYGERYALPVIDQVVQGSAAEEAGFQSGDRIIAFNGKEIEKFSDVVTATMLNMDQPANVTLDRGGEIVETVITPKIAETTDNFGVVHKVPRLGIIRANLIENKQLGPIDALIWGVQNTLRTMDMMLTTVGQVIVGVRPITDMGGPVKIGQVAGQAASLGMIRFIELMALISINLGLVNLFPIPMLDGGHLVMYGIEGIRKKPVPAKAQEFVFLAGMIFLLSLMVVMTYNDLAGLGLFS